jgi:DME family drug/metabolite transporter
VVLLEPLTAALVAVLVLGERLTPVSLVGCGLLLAAVLVMTRAARS